MIYTEYADVEYLKTPMESITGRIERCEDAAEKQRLGKVRLIYESDLSPGEMAERLMELSNGKGG